MSTVKLAYGASSNISFNGEIDTEIEQAEWDAMSTNEQDEIINEVVHELVEVWVVGE